MYSAKILNIVIILLLFFTVNNIWADSEVLPYPYMISSESGKYYFKMMPDEQNRSDREKGSGICYEVTSAKEDKILWTTIGWYSYQTYLSNDGKYLIRIGNWPRGHELSDKHLAVAFYKEGNLLKSYSTLSLVKDGNAIGITVSHYFWMIGNPIFDSFNKHFTIITIDNIEYVFDITNGNIISEKEK